jgi:hypothetical protein
VIVKFDKLHPVFSKSTEVPWIGNLMVSRWSYEAIAVTQSTQNKFESNLFDLNQSKYDASWKKDFWLPEMEYHINNLVSNKVSLNSKKDSKELLIKEINKEQANWGNLKCENCVEELNAFTSYSKSLNTYHLDAFLSTLKSQYIKTYNDKNEAIERYKKRIGQSEYTKMKDLYANEALNDIVTNRLESVKIVNYKNELFRNDNPIYFSDKSGTIFSAHFYAPTKYFFGIKVSTMWANLIALWVFIIFSFVALYYDWLKRILQSFEHWRNRILKKPFA